MHIPCAVRPSTSVAEGCGASFQARQAGLRDWGHAELARLRYVFVTGRQLMNDYVATIITFLITFKFIRVGLRRL